MLDIFKNIKAKRLELGMSQTELAKKVGYSDKSMIAKIESGKVDITQTRIMQFAKALGVTPSYLMGWTDEGDDYIDGVTSHMSQDESYADAGKKDAEILIKIHALNANNYNLLLNMLNTMLESQQQ